jgi:hypothetical protein
MISMHDGSVHGHKDHRVRRSLPTDKMPKREACKTFNVRWDTPRKILASPEPPKKRRKANRKQSVLGPEEY